MAELLPDAWQDENSVPEPGQPCRRTHRPPVMEIMLWLECFGRLAAVLSTRHPDKAAEFWAYQTSIIRVARNFEGTAWVAYDRQYRREALARRDLNWSACNAHLYNEAFMGRAKAIPRCQHCLNETHGSSTCPLSNAEPITLWQPAPRALAPDDFASKQCEICSNYNEGQCKFQSAGTCTFARSVSFTPVDSLPQQPVDLTTTTAPLPETPPPTPGPIPQLTRCQALRTPGPTACVVN